MSIPLTPDQVTESWLISALGHYHKNIIIKEINPIKNEGGILSSVIKGRYILKSPYDKSRCHDFQVLGTYVLSQEGLFVKNSKKFLEKKYLTKIVHN